MAKAAVGTIVLVLATLAPVLPATAESRTAGALTPLDTSLPDSILEQRIRFIEERLDRRRHHGQIWHWSWMTINAGSAVGLGVVAAMSRHEDDAVNNGVQAGVAAIGVADLLLRPLEARYGAAPIRDLPEATRTEKLTKLRAGEDQLQRNAERAEERESVTMHAANVLLNGVAGLVIGLAGNPSDGAIAAVTGTAGGVLNILTQPAAPADDWKDYQALVGQRRERPHYAVVPTLLAGGAGLSFRMTW
jgi:hypothetical protein